LHSTELEIEKTKEGTYFIESNVIFKLNKISEIIKAEQQSTEADVFRSILLDTSSVERS